MTANGCDSAFRGSRNTVRYDPAMDPNAMNPAMFAACVARDVAAIFRILLAGGMHQREIAALVRMSQ